MVFYDYNEAVRVIIEDDERIANNTLAENAPNNEFGDNIVLLGEEAGGNITFAVSGARNSIVIHEVTCVTNCDNGVVEDEDDETRVRYWSNSADWDNLFYRIPEEDDEVEIMEHWNMIFDIAETPKLKKL